MSFNNNTSNMDSNAPKFIVNLVDNKKDDIITISDNESAKETNNKIKIESEAKNEHEYEKLTEQDIINSNVYESNPTYGYKNIYENSNPYTNNGNMYGMTQSYNPVYRNDDINNVNIYETDQTNTYNSVDISNVNLYDTVNKNDTDTKIDIGNVNLYDTISDSESDSYSESESDYESYESDNEKGKELAKEDSVKLDINHLDDIELQPEASTSRGLPNLDDLDKFSKKAYLSPQDIAKSVYSESSKSKSKSKSSSKHHKHQKHHKHSDSDSDSSDSDDALSKISKLSTLSPKDIATSLLSEPSKKDKKSEKSDKSKSKHHKHHKHSDSDSDSSDSDDALSKISKLSTLSPKELAANLLSEQTKKAKKSDKSKSKHSKHHKHSDSSSSDSDPGLLGDLANFSKLSKLSPQELALNMLNDQSKKSKKSEKSDKSKSKHSKHHKHSDSSSSDSDPGLLGDLANFSKLSKLSPQELALNMLNDQSKKSKKSDKSKHSKHHKHSDSSSSDSDQGILGDIANLSKLSKLSPQELALNMLNDQSQKSKKSDKSKSKHSKHHKHSDSDSSDSNDNFIVDIANLSKLSKLSPQEIALNMLTDQVSKSSKKSKNQRIYWVDWLRVFASILIVFFQCSGDNIKPKVFGSANWIVLFIYNSLSKPCIPLFLMMSSMLLLNPKKELTYKKIIKKYFSRAITCYTIWSTYYNTFNTYVVNFKKIKYKWSWEQVGKTVLNIITAKNGDHMWYLKVIMGLYLVTPLFRKLTKNREQAWYITLIFMFCTQFFPTTFEFSFNELFKKLLEPFESVGGVVVYYILGHLLNTHQFKKKVYIRYIYYIGLAGAALTVGLRFLSSYVEHKEAKEFGSFGNINVGMAATGIFMFFKHALGDKIEEIMTKKNFINKAIINLSECSFGVYLIHMSVYHIFSRLNFHTQTLNPIYWTIIYTAILYLTSFSIIYLMRKVPILKAIT